MPRLVDQGVTRLTWVPGVDGIATITAPTLAELAAGRDLTCLMVSTYEVRMDASDTTSERAVCETANVDAPTMQNYMGRFELFREWDDALLAWETDDVLQWLDYKDVGYFVRRLGFPRDTAYAAGQQVEVYKLMADEAQVNGGTGTGYLKATVPMLKQGSATTRALVAA
ncbi:hypothetical protein [Glycomyces sp. NPDC021274]|uniref:phage tail tube protein n=1 Tax=Glycomyces sp. NPDC021274 TaxID=3155120 RepID=UPI0033E25770